MEGLIPTPNTSSWYRLPAQCIRWDQEKVGRRHTFVGPIPRGVPLDPGASSKVTSTEAFGPLSSAALKEAGLPYGASQWHASTGWYSAWPPEVVNPVPTMHAAIRTPQFAWKMSTAPVTVGQMDVESQLRRLDQPLGKCYQGVIPYDAPLHRNTVAPPMPVNVPPGVQNACNPLAAIRGPQGEGCREEADRVAAALSKRWINNPTRQDTQRLESPVAPPGVGSAGGRPGGVSLGGQLIC
jgi:hypothetical protein